MKSVQKNKILSEINSIQLPKEIEEVFLEYHKVAGRNKFLWQWMYKSVQVITAPFVNKENSEQLFIDKTLFIIFVTLLDDIADKEHNSNLLNELVKIPYKKELINRNLLDKDEIKYLNTTVTIWNQIYSSISNYVNFEIYKDLLEYDIEQVLNQMKYSILVNNNKDYINSSEFLEIIPYNMQAFVSYTFDFMFTNNFSKEKVGNWRNIIYYLQRMSKIDNWLSTWERELLEKDISNLIFVIMIEKKFISIEDLYKSPDRAELIIKNRKLEKELLKIWRDCYKIINKNNYIEKSQKNKVLEDAKLFLDLHLIAKELI